MKKAFYMLATIVIMMTMITTLHSFNDDYEWETRFHWNNKVWRVEQVGDDSKDSGDLSTYVSSSTQQKSLAHAMYTYASFNSDYVNLQIEGTWSLRAKLTADWATDEDPYEGDGDIVGKQGGMGENGKQSDTNWFADYDPLDTIEFIDSRAEAEAEVTVLDGTKYKSVSYSHFIPINIEWEELKP